MDTSGSNEKRKRRVTKTRVKRAAYAVCMALIAVLFFQSNNIAALMFAATSAVPRRVKGSVTSLEHTAEVQFNVSIYDVLDGMAERVMLGGYAVCGFTGAITADRDVEVILAADDYYYRIPAVQLVTHGGSWTPEGDLDLKTHMLAFGAEFTTVNIKNGDYRILLYVREGQGNRGFVYTEYSLSKQGKAVFPYLTRPVEDPAPTFSEIPVHQDLQFDVKVDVKTGEEENCAVTAGGWALFTDRPVKKSSGFVTFVDRNHNTATYPFVTHGRYADTYVYGAEFDDATFWNPCSLSSIDWSYFELHFFLYDDEGTLWKAGQVFAFELNKNQTGYRKTAL